MYYSLPSSGALSSFRRSLGKIRSRPGVFVVICVLFLLYLYTQRGTHLERSDPCGQPHRVSITTLDSRNQTWEAPSMPLPSSALLSERINAWRLSPLGGREMWSIFNEQYCSEARIGGQNNQHQVDASVKTWDSMTIDRVERVREELIRVLESSRDAGMIDANGEAVERGTGIGIVFCAGNADTFSRTITSLRLLRSYGTTLAAEVFHFSSELPTREEMDSLVSLGATLRAVVIQKDAGEVGDQEEKRIKNFHIKGEAFLSSSFTELLYLDSDSIPTKDITPLFSSPGYLHLGALFWPDYWKDSKENAIWSILGIQCRDGFQMEAGQVLINRARHFDALLLVEHMERNFQFYFEFSDGDKDLFRFAFLALRKRWSVPPRSLSSVSFPEDKVKVRVDSGETRGHTMLQFDPYGKPMFVHANTIKRYRGTFSPESTWGSTREIDFNMSSQYFNFSTARNTSDLAPFSDGNTTADQLANIDYTTGYGIEANRVLSSPSSYSNYEQLDMKRQQRMRAILEAGTFARFRNDYLFGMYVLCIDIKWEHPYLKLQVEDRIDHIEIGVEDKCVEDKLSIDWRGIEQSQVLTLVEWETDSTLDHFNKAFYDIGGHANGEGF